MGTNRPVSIGILADDLTSAADGAAPFVECGLRAAVGRFDLPVQAVPVVSVDSGARSATATEAAERVARLTARLAERDVLYKTVDSTLRGHITAELQACFWASGRSSLVFAPAFPQAGRTTVRGIQLVDGVPVSESAYGRDPVHPARQSALAELVPGNIAHVTLLDAVTQQELDEQVAAIAHPESVLWLGSPGMAMALSRLMVPVKLPPPPLAAIDRDVLVVIGSANRRSHLQADRLHGVAGATLLRGPVAREPDPAAVLRRLAGDAAQALRGGRFGAVIATGGDTMEAILDILGVREFEVLQELDPGFPLARALLGDGRQLLLAMKAGGFGDDDALAGAVERIRGAAPFLQKVLL